MGMQNQKELELLEEQTEMMQLEELHQTLDAVTEFLCADEMEVLVEVAQGLSRGLKIYGHLDIDTDERDFVAEGCEELRDCMVYVGAALRRMRRLGDS